MSGQTMQADFGRKTLPDYLSLAANIIYAIAGLLFVVGLYYDWQRPGVNFFAETFGTSFLAIADEPHANSGLFILAILLLVGGYLISITSEAIVSWQTEKVDQTQEWTVSVGDDK